MRNNIFVQLAKLRLRNSRYLFILYGLIFLLLGSLPAVSVLVYNALSPVQLKAEDKKDIFHSSKMVTFLYKDVEEKILNDFPIKSRVESAAPLFLTELLFRGEQGQKIMFQLRPLSLLKGDDSLNDGYIGTKYDEVVVSGRRFEQNAIVMENDFGQKYTLKPTGYFDSENYYIFVNNVFFDILTYNSGNTSLQLIDKNTAFTTLIDNFKISGDDEFILVPAPILFKFAKAFSIPFDTPADICDKLNDLEIVVSNEYYKVEEKGLKFAVTEKENVLLPQRFLKYFIDRKYSNVFFENTNEAQRLYDYLLDQDIETLYRDIKYDYNEQKTFVPELFIYGMALLFMVLISLFTVIINHSRSKERSYLLRKKFLYRPIVLFDRSLFIFCSLLAFAFAHGILLIARFCFFDVGHLTYITASQFNIANTMILFTVFLIFLLERRKGLYHV